MENMFLALGADATRRIKREADAPMLRGDRGACLVLGEFGMVIECWDELAVAGFESDRPRLRNLSGWTEFLRACDEVERETQGDVEGVCEPLGTRPVRPLRAPPESLERVSDELYEYRSSLGVVGTTEGDAQTTWVSVVGVAVGVVCVSIPSIGDSSSLSFFDRSVLNIPLRFKKDDECPSVFARTGGSLLVILGEKRVKNKKRKAVAK